MSNPALRASETTPLTEDQSDYELLRDAIVEHLDEFIHEDDVAEVAIFLDAIKNVAAEIKTLRAVSAPRVPEETARRQIVAISGSTRFVDVMAVVAWEFEKRGILALGCHLLPQWYTNAEHHLGEEQGVADTLDALHLRKIDMADWLYVVNVDGYIGRSTAREIEYATLRGIPIEYREAINV